MSIISNAKEIAELVKKLGNVDLYRRIVDLEGEIIELSGENHALKERIAELEKNLKLRAELKFESGVYWRIDGQTKEGPFCQRCYDADGKLLRLHPQTADGYDSRSNRVLPNAERYFKCFQCNAIYDQGT